MLSEIFSECAPQFDDDDDRHDDGNATSRGNGLFSKPFPKSSYYSGLQQSQASSCSTNTCITEEETVTEEQVGEQQQAKFAHRSGDDDNNVNRNQSSRSTGDVKLINACHAAILEDWSKEGIMIDSKGQHELLNHLTSSFPRLAELEARETHYKAMAQEASESQNQLIAKNGQVIAKIVAKNLLSTRNQNGSAFEELHKQIKNLRESNSVIAEHLFTTKSEVKSKDQEVRDMRKQLNNLSLHNRMMEKDNSSLQYRQNLSLKRIEELIVDLNASTKKIRN